MHAAMAWLRLLCWLSSFIRAESSAPGAPHYLRLSPVCPRVNKDRVAVAVTTAVTALQRACGGIMKYKPANSNSQT